MGKNSINSWTFLIKLMYYVYVYTFFEEPEKDWLKIQTELEIEPCEPALFPEFFQ